MASFCASRSIQPPMALTSSFVARPGNLTATISAAPGRRAHNAPRQVTVMGAKKVTKIIKLAIDAGKANPAPPIGPALGAAGLNIMEFCKAYNAQTADKAGQVIPVEISVYEDRSFSFVLKTPPASKLVLAAAGLTKGSGNPKKVIATITEEQLREIATTKLPDLNALTVEGAMNIVHGTCRNMGVEVVGRSHRIGV